MGKSENTSTLKSVVARGAGLLLVVLVGMALLVPPWLEKCEERRIRDLLLTVQEALQNFHVDEEIYPKRRMDGRELVAFLVEEDFLEGDVVNPWTGAAYLDADPEAEDWLRYRTNALADGYELIVLHAGTEEPRFRLDSSENQSLE